MMHEGPVNINEGCTACCRMRAKITGVKARRPGELSDDIETPDVPLSAHQSSMAIKNDL